MYERKKMLDRKMLWLKRQELPNPQKEAKMLMRKQKERETQSNVTQKMYPPPFMDVYPSDRFCDKLLEEGQRKEMESRFRQRIRTTKLANAKLMKAAVPDVAGIPLDPIKRHVHRRLVRQRVKIHAGLEEVLTIS